MATINLRTQAADEANIVGCGVGTLDIPFFPVAGDLLIEAAKGNVPRHYIVCIPGYLAAVGAVALGDLSPVPSVVILPNPGGIQLALKSTSGSDTAAGTGVRTVGIHYLDPDYNEQEEVVIMNGATLVNTVATNINHIQWIHTESVGSGGIAAGNISVVNLAETITYEYITAGGNQSLSSRYTIPLGKTGFLLNWHVSGLKKRMNFFLRATCDRTHRNFLEGVFLFQDTEVCENSNSGLLSGKGLSFPEKTTIKISAQAEVTGGQASGSFSLLIVENVMFA